MTRRTALRRIGGAAAAVGLALVGRGRTEAAACRGLDAVCREHANCCSGVCGPKNQTGRRVCACPADEPLCNGKCCPIGACVAGPGFDICLTELSNEVPANQTETIAATWKAIFEEDALAPTLSVIGFAPQPGHPFQILTAGPDWPSTLVRAEVVEAEFPTRMVFRWQSDEMAEPATGAVIFKQTEKGPRVGVTRIAGDPASCDHATTLIGRRWQKALLGGQLQQYLARTQAE